MQHRPWRPDSKTCHKKKETEHATQAMKARQQDMPQEEGIRTCSTLLVHQKPILLLQIRIKMPQHKVV
jgi:hypothetical protein